MISVDVSGPGTSSSSAYVVGWECASTHNDNSATFQDGYTMSTTAAPYWKEYDGTSATSFNVGANGQRAFVLDVSPVPEPINEAMLIFGSVLALGGLGRYSWNRFKPTSALVKA
jgi:hypothetical protein